MVQLAARTIDVVQAIDLLAVTDDVLRLRMRDDLDVRQAVQLALQHGIGAQLLVEFDQRHVTDHAGQIDRRLDAGIAAADHGHILALEQRTVAMRAVGHAVVAVFALARHVDFAPARTGRQDDRAALQRGTAGQRQMDVAVAGVRCRHELVDPLQVHHVDVVGLHVLFQCGDQLGPFGFLHRNEVLDAQRVHHLTAEALGDQPGADALARGVDRRRRAGWPATDDQHVERCARRHLFGFALGDLGIQLRKDFLDRHAALTEVLTVQEDHRHRHDLALFDFLLEQRAVDRDRADARVQHCHQVERLHDIRAVVAGQAHEDFEVEVGVERLDLVDHFLFNLRRMPARLQQRQHQRGEFMAERNGGEAQLHVATLAVDRERGLALVVVALLDQRDQVRQFGDFRQQ